jgi:NAD(P)H-dependent flavin oxidoreductase YrpB (nitropropane dioxygenase family)
MNKFLQIIVSSAAVSLLAISTAPAQAKKAEPSQTTAQAKIDQKQAEKLVLKKYPGANIVSCTESTAGGHAAWLVSFTSIGASTAQKVYVDQESGKISH